MNEETLKAVVNLDGTNQEMDVIKKQDGFDGMTGEPVMKYVCQDGFDPMTGQPVYIDLVSDGFDGMTGKPLFLKKKAAAPIMPQGAPTKAAGFKFDLSKIDFKDLQKMLPVYIAGGAVVLVAIVLIIGFATGLFVSKRNKVALATYKTVSESTIGKAILDSASLFGSDKLTASINGEASVEGYDVNFDIYSAYNAGKSKADITANVEVGDVFDQTVDLYFDDSMIAAGMPEITNDVYYYNYKSDNDGYFSDLLDISTDGDISDVNTIISGLSKIMKKSSSTEKAITKAVKKAYKNVEVVSIGKDSFKIDDKDRKCAGYEMTITGDNIADLVILASDASNKINGDIISGMLDAVSNLLGKDMSDYEIDDPDYYEEIADSLSDIDDLVLDFYLYKGKLAAIETKLDGTKYSLQFRGGDNRASNIVLSEKSSSSSSSIKLKSKMNKKTEEGSIIIDKNQVASYEYNPKTGDFSIELPMLGEFEGVYKVNKHKLTAYTELNLGIATADVEVVSSDKASIKKPEGNYVDLGNADEDDIRDIVEELGESLGSLLTNSGMIENIAGGLGSLL